MSFLYLQIFILNLSSFLTIWWQSCRLIIISEPERHPRSLCSAKASHFNNSHVSTVIKLGAPSTHGRSKSQPITGCLLSARPVNTNNTHTEIATLLMRMDPVLRLGAPHKVTEGHTTSLDCCSVQTHKLSYWTQVSFIKVFHNWIKTQLRPAWVEAFQFVCVFVCKSALAKSTGSAGIWHQLFVSICLILLYYKTSMSARVYIWKNTFSKSTNSRFA